MERKLLFREQSFSANGPFDSPFKQGALTELGIAIDGTNTGAPANAADDGALALLGTMDLVQFGQSRIKAEARSLFHLAQFYNGGYAYGPGEDLANDVFARRFLLPLHRMMDGAGIDASGVEVFWKGTFQTLAHYSGTAPTAITATLRPWATTADKAPASGFHAPEFTEHTIDLSSAALKNSVQIDFKTTVLLPGIQIMALDNDGGNGTDASARVDGLARRVTVELNEPGEPRKTLVDNLTWGQLRSEHARLGQFSQADETSSAGVVFVPLFQRRGGVKRDALEIKAGSDLTVFIDNTSTVEGNYTAVTPDASDRALILAPSFLSRLGEAEVAAATAVTDVGVTDQLNAFNARRRTRRRRRRRIS